jgi:hypothetical protein
MFLLFGFGQEKAHDYGPALPVICPNCHNPVHLRLLEIKKWFSLFFIPVLPYESKYMLACEICSRGVPLTERQFERARKVCRAARAYRAGRISEAKYNRILERSRLLRLKRLRPPEEPREIVDVTDAVEVTDVPQKD